MFERFTDRARRVIVLAQEEARMLSHSYIGTEHILLGLIHESGGVAATALQRLGVSLEVVRAQVEEIIDQGQQVPSGYIPFTPRAKKVLELALREALQLGHSYIGTEHILLGLIREGQGVAAQVLQQNLDGDLDRVRREVIELLSGLLKAPSEKGTPRKAPALSLRIRETERHIPVVELAGIDITSFLASDGLKIEYRDHGGGPSFPSVTMTFATGKLDLDLDVELLEHLLADARGRSAVD